LRVEPLSGTIECRLGGDSTADRECTMRTGPAREWSACCALERAWPDCGVTSPQVGTTMDGKPRGDVVDIRTTKKGLSAMTPSDDTTPANQTTQDSPTTQSAQPTMRAMRQEEFGGPEVLHEVEVPRPAP